MGLKVCFINVIQAPIAFEIILISGNKLDQENLLAKNKVYGIFN